MKTIILLFFITLTLSANQVEVNLDFKLNETHSYNIIVKNVQNINGQSVSNETVYKMTHKLLEDNEDGLLFSWKYSDYVVPKEVKGVSKELEKMNEGLEIRYYTTKNGLYKTIENWDEILDFFNKKLKKIQNDFWGDEEAKSYVQSIEKNLLTPEKLSEYLLTELMLFHNFYGAKLALNKEEVNTINVEDQYLSIELPILNKSTLNKNSNKYILEVNEHIDQMRASKIISDLEKKENLEKINYKNQQNFLYTFNNKFIIQDLQYQKDVEINSQKMEKFVQISIIN